MLRKTFYLCPCLNNFCHVVPSSTPNDKVTPSFVEVYDIKFVFYDICLSEERLIFFSADTGKCLLIAINFIPKIIYQIYSLVYDDNVELRKMLITDTELY